MRVPFSLRDFVRNCIRGGLCFLVPLTGSLAAEEISLSSGGTHLLTRLNLDKGTSSLVWMEGGESNPTCTLKNPLSLQVNEETLEEGYQDAALQGGTLLCGGSLTSKNGTQFIFRDKYQAGAAGSFAVERNVEIINESPLDRYFNSSLRFEVKSKGRLEDHEVFVPGVWYRTNFKSRMSGVLAANPKDRSFLFREDRLPLPLVLWRDTDDGATLSLLHSDSIPVTVCGDRGAARVVDEAMQFGSLGMQSLEGISLTFMYPGSEGERNHVDRSASHGWALRSHPVNKGVAHHYNLLLTLSRTGSYPAAVEAAWKQAFECYQPMVRPVDLNRAFHGLIETLDYYAVGPAQGYDAPGFPFSVRLPEGTARAYSYQMGFIGRQLPNAFFLIHEGIAQKREELLKKGEAITDFWAEQSLLPSGLPRTWYNPSDKKNIPGIWRKGDNRNGGTAIRPAADGMEGMLSAWQLMKSVKKEKPAWIAACRSFGDWLVKNQNADGSYFLAYSHEWIDGRHPPAEASKSTSTNPIRFLTMLYQATGDASYLSAANRAGEFCLKNIHADYLYAGSVIDNPNVIDRESGQEAICAFLALYDFSKEARWLEAAVQAARYTETWMYAYEVPATEGIAPSDFPKNRSIVGQTLIASGHSAADLGLAFSAYDYYRLFLFTGDPHFLTVARLLVHNTKQALNWDDSLYPGKPRGLQLEAFWVTVPRRKGVMECLSWNFTAHLDPLIRFQDRFGSIDIDEIEKLSPELKREWNTRVDLPR